MDKTYDFGIFTDDEFIFNSIKDEPFENMNIKGLRFGHLEDSHNEDRPFRCVNQNSVTDWKYFIGCKVTPVTFLSK